jgi:hypothetical protein
MSEGTATAQRLNELFDIEESQRLFMAACRPSRTLLEGMPYVPASQTDIRKTFERVRNELQMQPRL